MKKTFLLVFISVSILLTATAFVLKSSGGIVGRTGSPGETGCNACHGGGAGTTQVTISSVPAFVGNQYIPGQTYTVSVNVSNSNFSKFGFGCEILNASNTNAGSMTTALAGVSFANFGVKKNAIHSTPKSGTGTASFEFVWVAPLSGGATIYAAGNAIDGTGSTGGDRAGLTNLVLTPNLITDIKEPLQTGIYGFDLFPNPIRSDFRMNYNLEEAGKLTVGLYDIQGKLVAELINEYKTQGAHQLNMQLPSEVVSSTYFVIASINGKTPLRRIVIVQ